MSSTDPADPSTSATPRPGWVTAVLVAAVLGVSMVVAAVGTELFPWTSTVSPRPGSDTRAAVDPDATGTTGRRTGVTSSAVVPGLAAPVHVSGMTTLTPAQATRQLRAAGRKPYGEVRQALRWSDRNGANLLVASRHVDAARVGTATAATIRVLHLVTVDSSPRVLRVMTDPSGEPCGVDFRAEIVPDVTVAGDLDGDGYAEVSVAWSTSCHRGPAPSVTKVALLSNGRKYILRGIGWPFGRPAVSDRRPDDFPDARIEQSDPPGATWPKGFLAPTEGIYRRLFF